MKLYDNEQSIKNWYIVRLLSSYYGRIKENSFLWKLLVVVSAFTASFFSIKPYIDSGVPAKDIILCILGTSACVCALFLPFRSPFRSCHWDFRIIFIILYALIIRRQIYMFSLSMGKDTSTFTSSWIMSWLLTTAAFSIVLLFNLLLHRLYHKNNKIALKIYEFMFKYSLISKVRGKNERRIKKFSILSSLVVLISFVLIFTSMYLNKKFPHMDFETILFTIRFANGSYSKEDRNSIILMALSIIIISAVFYILLYRKERAEKLVLTSPDRKNSIEMKMTDSSKWISFLLPAALFAYGIFNLSDSVKLFEFIKRNTSLTTLYEDHYVAPTTDIIHFPEKKKNLIYIYLESYENTFTSFGNGGNQPTDLMPEIYELEKNNINFSHRSGIGGQSVFFPMIMYTMGSTVAQTSGVPLTSILNFEHNQSANTMSSMMSPLRRLEDILHDEGYNQLFIRGENTRFAGYNKYVGRYENSEIYDAVSALNEGFIDDSYSQPWGLEDRLLFIKIKEKIEELAAKDAPFCVSTYTVDTHSVEGGFRCKLCDPEIKDDFAAAIKCSSRQINDFINWLSEKPYWKDTVVIFVGDHPAELCVDGVRFDEDKYVRTTCNCIINSEKTPVNEKNRTFCAMDMFPTTLSAIGCDIDGDRLGLGTDLFSATPTLCEEMGADKFVEEVQKKSEYYINTFFVPNE